MGLVCRFAQCEAAYCLVHGKVKIKTLRLVWAALVHPVVSIYTPYTTPLAVHKPPISVEIAESFAVQRLDKQLCWFSRGAGDFLY